MNNYSIAFYLRLSKEDINSNDYSESIENQKNMLLKYAKENNYSNISVYIDDGYTGTNFERPNFKKMINDINNNIINMVVVKDLSRFGRDYIKVGYYLEDFFPRKNIRFVSLLDGIDSSCNNLENEYLPFKSIINDIYSKDNSKKIRAALKTKQEEGKWVGGCTPFGYMKDPNDHNHLMINEEEADIVKKIFRLFLSGLSLNKISNYLYQEKIPTPSLIRKINRNTKYACLGYWSSNTIKQILKNELYTGDLIQNRRKRISYKIRKLIKNKKEDWIICKNTHEPIISKQDFIDAKRILNLNGNIKSKKENLKLLSGLLYCNDCHSKIMIQKSGNNYYTVCNTYRRYSKLDKCTSHSMSYKKIEEIVLNNITKIINKIDKKRIKDSIIRKINNSLKIESQIDKINKILENLYIDKLQDKISEKQYNQLANRFKKELQILKERKTINYNLEIDSFLKEINRKIVIRLIKKIEIGKNKEINIFFNFSNNLS